MICNVIDNRTRPYRWRRIDAIIEATSHDNACADSDQQPESQDDLVYSERKGISLGEAIAWANDAPSSVTLYIHDEGGNDLAGDQPDGASDGPETGPPRRRSRLGSRGGAETRRLVGHLK
jgi:hypothetical protein